MLISLCLLLIVMRFLKECMTTLGLLSRELHHLTDRSLCLIAWLLTIEDDLEEIDIDLDGVIGVVEVSPESLSASPDLPLSLHLSDCQPEPPAAAL